MESIALDQRAVDAQLLKQLHERPDGGAGARAARAGDADDGVFDGHGRVRLAVCACQANAGSATRRVLCRRAPCARPHAPQETHLYPTEAQIEDRVSEPLTARLEPDRQSDVSGKSLSVRVDIGGSRIIKKKKTQHKKK